MGQFSQEYKVIGENSTKNSGKRPGKVLSKGYEYISYFSQNEVVRQIFFCGIEKHTEMVYY